MASPDKPANPKSPAWIIVGALVLVAAGAVAYQARDLTPHHESTPQAYYTTDDGKTLFTHDADALPTFDHDGKPAVLAHVYQCDGQQFVGYLERYTPAALTAATQLKSASGSKPGPNAPKIDPRTIQLATTPMGREVKRPGDPTWIPLVGAAGSKITAVKSPNGKASTPEPVIP